MVAGKIALTVAQTQDEKTQAFTEFVSEPRGLRFHMEVSDWEIITVNEEHGYIHVKVTADYQPMVTEGSKVPEKQTGQFRLTIWSTKSRFPTKVTGSSAVDFKKITPELANSELFAKLPNTNKVVLRTIISTKALIPGGQVGNSVDQMYVL